MKVKVRYNLIINGIEQRLDANKLLVGSAPNCDIIINDPQKSVSHYHGIFFINPLEGSISFLDLNSENGTFINGSKLTHQTSFFDGDTIMFGKIRAELIESDDKFEFDKRDEEIHVFSELKDEKQYVPRQTNDNEVLIDDEYCDIVFDDQKFIPLFKSPLNGYKIDSENYIETNTLEDGFEIRESIDGNCLQITTSLSGHILDQYYFPLQDGTIFGNNKEKNGQVLVDLSKGKRPLIKIENGQITLQSLEGFSSQESTMTSDQAKVLSTSLGPYQIFAEVANVPSNLIQISSLERDKYFLKDTAKKFAGVIIPMLLLLFVNFTPDKEKPIKKLSIIYKKPTKAAIDDKKLASSQVNDTKKNTGHKATKQPDKKIAHSKSGKKAKPKKAPAKKIAKASPPTKKAPSKSKAKTKAYSFKMAPNIASVFSSSKSVSVANNKAPSSVSTTSTESGSLATKVSGTSSDKIGQMGSDAAGRATASFGSKGLSSKSGRDTAYIQTETVVLGSMDPELLRKILQQYLPQFRHCYQQELAYNSEDIKGIVDLNFEITGSGKVAKIKVRAKDSRFSKKGTNCMANVLAIIDFPKPKGGGRVAVRQPLSFFSEKERS